MLNFAHEFCRRPSASLKIPVGGGCEFRAAGWNSTFVIQPRADVEHFCVALASMISKYVRELMMMELEDAKRTIVFLGKHELQT